MHGAGGGGVLRRGGFVAKQRDALQAEFVPQCAKIPSGVAADDRHAAVGHSGAGTDGDGGGHGLGLGLAAGGGIADDGRVGWVHRAVRRIGRVGQQQVQFGQRGDAGVALVLGQNYRAGGHVGVGGHPL